MDAHDAEKLIAGYRLLADFLTKEGFPISRSSLAKYCSPAIGSGPPIESYWGRLPCFKPSVALAWARSRMRPAAIGRGRQADSAAA
jgi:hypothetical protein